MDNSQRRYTYRPRPSGQPVTRLRGILKQVRLQQESAHFKNPANLANEFQRNSFRVPSPTTSDEEEIEREEKAAQNARLACTEKKRESVVAEFLEEVEVVNTGLEAKRQQQERPFTFVDRKGPLSLPPPPSMVIEREPPNQTPQKPPSSSASFQQPQVEFGKPSPLQNRLQAQNGNGVFNVPKQNKPRPEHHRPENNRPNNQPAPPQLPPAHFPQSRPVNYGQPPVFYNPLQPRPVPNDPDVVEIPKPTNYTWKNPYVAPSQPMYSAFPPGQTGRAWNPAQQYIDLTKPNDTFDPDAALYDDKFGAADPFNYVDSEKAAENIKALLEGTFDDEDDKPKTRSRKQKNADALADKLKSLAVNSEEDKENQNGQAEDETEEEEGDDGTVEGLEVKLLPHQVEGVEWMKDKEVGVKKKNGILPKGGILADDMGLGKTIQSIALILTNPRPPLSSSDKDKKAIPINVGRNTLIVAPLALIRQWESELKDKVSDSHRLRVCIHHGPQRTKRFEDLKRYDIVITTYQILVSEHGGSSPREDGPQVGCFGIHWYRVILDEAHTIKNRNAKATQACYALRSEYRWCLTGTPMQNNLDELQSLIKFLRIKPYNDLNVWRDQITRPMSQGRGGIAMKRLQYYLKAFMKRRTKDILKKDGALNPGGKKGSRNGLGEGFKIVDRKVESLLVEFSLEEREFYDRLEQRAGKNLDEMIENEGMNYASALVLLLRLRQACNHPKLLGGALTKDKDALTTDQNAGKVTKETKAADKAVDDMAELLGGLSVETRKCDICQNQLSKDDVSSGSFRCNECEQDLDHQAHVKRKKKHKHKKISSKEKSNVKISKGHARRVIPESSDEEGEGSWLVSKDQRQITHLGKAGGTDDEDAEGGGESLGDSDSDTDNEDSSMPKPRPSKVINLDTPSTIPDSQPTSDESDSDSSSSDSSPSQKLFKSPPPPAISAKIRHLLQILRQESRTHKFIVYSQFTSMLDLVEPFLLQAKITFTRYDGSMPNDAREASLARLRSSSPSSPRILLCSLKCGSLGLNLTAASRVVILEPFWNPFVEEQAIDRVHRLNQTVNVVVYKLTVADTVEARILELQERKRQLAKEAIEGGAVGKKGETAKLSMKDILALFGRDAEFQGLDGGNHRVGSGRGGGVSVGASQPRILTGGLHSAASSTAATATSSASNGSYPNRPVYHADADAYGKAAIGASAAHQKQKGPVGGSNAVRKEDPIYGRRW